LARGFGDLAVKRLEIFLDRIGRSDPPCIHAAMPPLAPSVRTVPGEALRNPRFMSIFFACALFSG
jgi:hypothetical protein